MIPGSVLRGCAGLLCLAVIARQCMDDLALDSLELKPIYFITLLRWLSFILLEVLFWTCLVMSIFS